MLSKSLLATFLVLIVFSSLAFSIQSPDDGTASGTSGSTQENNVVLSPTPTEWPANCVNVGDSCCNSEGELCEVKVICETCGPQLDCAACVDSGTCIDSGPPSGAYCSSGATVTPGPCCLGALAPPKTISLTIILGIILVVLLVIAGYAASASGKPTSYWKGKQRREKIK